MQKHIPILSILYRFDNLMQKLISSFNHMNDENDIIENVDIPWIS